MKKQWGDIYCLLEAGKGKDQHLGWALEQEGANKGRP